MPFMPLLVKSSQLLLSLSSYAQVIRKMKFIFSLYTMARLTDIHRTDMLQTDKVQDRTGRPK